MLASRLRHHAHLGQSRRRPQQFDADNRAVAMTNTTTGGRVQFVYDGDGRPLCRTLRVAQGRW